MGQNVVHTVRSLTREEEALPAVVLLDARVMQYVQRERCLANSAWPDDADRRCACYHRQCNQALDLLVATVEDRGLRWWNLRLGNSTFRIKSAP